MSFANDYFRADALTLITSQIQSFVYNGDILWSERERERERENELQPLQYL